MDAASDTILAHDLEGNIIYINEAACKDHGYTHEEFIHMNLKDIDTPESADLIQPRIKELLEKGDLVFECTHFRKDKSILPIEVHASVFELNGKKIILAVNRNITERKKAEQEIKFLAYHNPLTKLPNRRLFFNQLEKAVTKAKQENSNFSLLYIDLDRFKNVNDTLGHKTGDWLLVSVSETLFNYLTNDDLIAHMGGDEFMIMLSNINSTNDVKKVCQSMLNAFEAPFYINDFQLYSAISIGATIYPNDGQDIETLIKNADIAMYKAKESGGNNYKLYTPALNQECARKFELENSLHRALDNNEFELYYQPQVNIATGQIAGVEALLRWHHPKFGLVPPSDFIPLAEASGHIIAIGEWVLRTACVQNKTWLDEGLKPITMSVNVSLRQLQHKSFLTKVANILKETGLDPNLLVLEITESVSAQNSKHIYNTINTLASMGIKISMDDFGKGYSTLVNLKKFSVNTLKIDRDFIKEIANDTKSEAIITTTIALAKNLGVKVVAEGVETEEQLAFLKEMDCAEMQGYLFSRPLPSEQINRILRQQ